MRTSDCTTILFYKFLISFSFVQLVVTSGFQCHQNLLKEIKRFCSAGSLSAVLFVSANHWWLVTSLDSGGVTPQLTPNNLVIVLDLFSTVLSQFSVASSFPKRFKFFQLLSRNISIEASGKNQYMMLNGLTVKEAWYHKFMRVVLSTSPEMIFRKSINQLKMVIQERKYGRRGIAFKNLF